jgi:hypothetical protein
MVILILLGFGLVAGLSTSSGRRYAAKWGTAGIERARRGLDHAIDKRRGRGVYTCAVAGCGWTQNKPSTAAIEKHLVSHRNKRRPRPGPVPQPRPAPGPERIVTVADGVRIGYALDQITRRMEHYVTEFRAISRACANAGEAIAPKTLHGLLDALAGVSGALVAVAGLIDDVAAYGDREMWVDPRAIGPVYEVAAHITGELDTLRKSMAKIREMYAAQLDVENAATDPAPAGRPRPLNPQVVQAGAPA